MSQMLHTILGPSGGVGREILAELQSQNSEIRVVERSSKINGFDTFEADLLDPAQADKALQGSGIVYLCVGLPYNLKVWSQSWPLLMDNVINSCEKWGSKLVFLDNIYMYGPPPLRNPIEEDHPQEPISKKGRIRKLVVEKLIRAVENGRLEACIARAPDFYGPYAFNSILYISFLERMLKGKSPQSLFPLGVNHTYSFTPDIARAMIALGKEDEVNGEVFHTPVGEPITIEGIADLMNEILETDLRVSVIPGFIKSLISLFVPALKELNEMNYQFTTDYILSDQKFRKRFPSFNVTSNREGIAATIEAFKSRTS